MNEFTDTKRFPLKAAYLFGEEHTLGDEVIEIKKMAIEWDRSYDSTVRRGRLIRLFEKKELLSKFQQERWPYGATEEGQAELRRCLKIWAEYEAFLAGSPVPTLRAEEEAEEASLQFAIEAHLRDFLARNLETIEPGLKLYEHEGRSGIEFPVEGGRIDILALDSSGKFVVLELKLSQGRNKALGQLLYYMGWIDEHLGNPPSRGIIVANEIGPELITAVSRAPGVKLAKYRISFVIEWVQGENASAV